MSYLRNIEAVCGQKFSSPRSDARRTEPCSEPRFASIVENSPAVICAGLAVRDFAETSAKKTKASSGARGSCLCYLFKPNTRLRVALFEKEPLILHNRLRPGAAGHGDNPSSRTSSPAATRAVVIRCVDGNGSHHRV